MIIFFSECFYVFAQVYVSKYIILLSANNRIHVNLGEGSIFSRFLGQFLVSFLGAFDCKA